METNDNESITNLKNLLNSDTRKFTSSEIQLKNRLPHWISNAGSLKLKTVLQKYYDYILDHLQKLEEIFKEEKINSMTLTNHVMEALIKEVDEKSYISVRGTPLYKTTFIGSYNNVNQNVDQAEKQMPGLKTFLGG